MTINQFNEYRPHRNRRRGQDSYAWPEKTAPKKQAPILGDSDVRRVESSILANSRAPVGDLIKIHLTLYAGLRVSEVANLHITDLLEADGSVAQFVTVRPKVGKGGKGRRIPMHPKLAATIREYRRLYPSHDFVAFSQTWYTPKPQKTATLTCQFRSIYAQAGLSGYSSHSGRRTFITNLAKQVGRNGFTLRDIQILAGHARLETTEAYIEPSANMDKLIRRLK